MQAEEDEHAREMYMRRQQALARRRAVEAEEKRRREEEGAGSKRFGKGKKGKNCLVM